MRRKELSELISEPKDLDRFIVSASFAIGRNPTLKDCSQQSLIAAVYTAAELRLDFTPALGLAYLVPYKGQCQFQIGYRGLGTLAVRCGAVVGFEGHVVQEFDKFECQLGTSAYIKHERPTLGKPRGGNAGAYAIITLPGGYKQFDVMDVNELNAIRARSVAWQHGGGPWKTDDAEMRKKTVTKRLFKYANLSPEIGKALEADAVDYDDDMPIPAMLTEVRRDKIDALIDEPPAPVVQTPGPIGPEEAARIREQEKAEAGGFTLDGKPL